MMVNYYSGPDRGHEVLADGVNEGEWGGGALIQRQSYLAADPEAR